MLRDVIAGSGLHGFAEIGLAIFLVTFLVVAVRVLSRRSGHYDEIARLPLRDDQSDAPSEDRGGEREVVAPRSAR